VSPIEAILVSWRDRMCL